MSIAQNPEVDAAMIVRAVMRLSRRLRRSAPAVELTGGGLTLLAALHRGGSMSAVALARSEGLQPQSLSRLLARMEGDGLIQRDIDPADRRRHVIALTPRGLGALDWAMSQRRQWMAAAVVDQLNEDERQTLVKAAELMLRLSA